MGWEKDASHKSMLHGEESFYLSRAARDKERSEGIETERGLNLGTSFGYERIQD
jgi:hypothetical protein